jgi:hypothetical protein
MAPPGPSWLLLAPPGYVDGVVLLACMCYDSSISLPTRLQCAATGLARVVREFPSEVACFQCTLVQVFVFHPSAVVQQQLAVPQRFHMHEDSERHLAAAADQSDSHLPPKETCPGRCSPRLCGSGAPLRTSLPPDTQPHCDILSATLTYLSDSLMKYSIRIKIVANLDIGRSWHTGTLLALLGLKQIHWFSKALGISTPLRQAST